MPRDVSKQSIDSGGECDDGMRMIFIIGELSSQATFTTSESSMTTPLPQEPGKKFRFMVCDECDFLPYLIQISRY